MIGRMKELSISLLDQLAETSTFLDEIGEKLKEAKLWVKGQVVALDPHDVPISSGQKTTIASSHAEAVMGTLEKASARALEVLLGRSGETEGQRTFLTERIEAWLAFQELLQSWRTAGKGFPSCSQKTWNTTLDQGLDGES